ncbi:MAG: hypothetical protein KAX88_04565 [Rhodoferax sp.]|nr:hypothetical protein [Rhodoferax sp.]
MSILIRNGTVQTNASARCAVCGKTGVHMGVTAAHLDGEPEFYHYGCMVTCSEDNVTELIFAGGVGSCTARQGDGG